MKWLLLTGVLLLNVLGAGLASAAQMPAYSVLASIRPIALLTRELAGDLPIRVDTLLPEGATPHDYALSPSDLGRIRDADLVVWLGPVTEPYLRKLMRGRNNDLRWGELPDLLRLPAREALHDHGHDGHALDPHLWWSVPNAIQLARALEQRIGSARPAWQATLKRNREALENRLQTQLVQQRKRYAKGFKPFLLAHDAFFYLEEDLGIRSDGAIMLDPEAKPGVKLLMALKQRVAAQNIGCVLTGMLVPASLIDKIDTDPPLLRERLDELAWDYPGARYSEWLAQAYARVAECVGVSSN